MKERELAVPLKDREYVEQFGYNGSLFLYITSKVTGETNIVELDEKFEDD